MSIGCQEYYLAEDASKLKNHCSMAERHYGARSWSYKNRMGLSPLATVPVHNAVHWRSRSRNKIKYSPKLPASQQHMRNLIVKEARKHGTAVAFINMPYALFAKPMNKIVVPTMKKSDIAYHVPILSLNRKKLFPKLSNKEVAAYYARKNREKLHHFHMSGAIYFTNMITPSIVGLYKKLVLDEQRGADK